MKSLKDLTPGQKETVFDDFIDYIKTTSQKGGYVMGTNQIIERLKIIAIKDGFMKCPYCNEGS